MPIPESALSVLKVLGAVAGPVSRLVKRLMAERAAVQNPAKALEPLHETVASETLSRIGAATESSGFFARLGAKVGGKIVQQEVFELPHAHEFVRLPEVQKLLLDIQQEKLAGAEPDPHALAKLKALYSEVSGEDEQHAEGFLTQAIAVIYAGTTGAISDVPLAAMVQASSATILKEVQKSRPHPAATQSVVDGSALQELRRILTRRAFPGEKTLEEMQSLLADLAPQGRFELATLQTKREALNWAVRLFAANDKADAATEAAHDMRRLGQELDLLSTAYLEAANGRLEDALRRADEIDSADAHGVVFSLLRRSGDDHRASEYLKRHSLGDANAFTPLGWVNVIIALLQWDRLPDVHEVTVAFPPDFGAEQPPLRATMGLAAASELVPESRRNRLFLDGPLLLLHGTLGTPEALQWRQEAIDHFTAAAQAYASLGCEAPAADCKRWASVLRLSDASTRKEEMSNIREQMKDAKTAADLILLAYPAEVDFDPVPLERHLARREIAGGLTDEERIAKSLLLAATRRWPEFIAYVRREWDDLLQVTPPPALVFQMCNAMLEIGELESAQRFLDEHRQLLGEEHFIRMSMLLAQHRGSDPSTEAIELYRRTGDNGDLRNVVQSLERHKRWNDLLPFSRELFNREPHIRTALRHISFIHHSGGTAKDAFAFIEAARERVPLNLNFNEEEAWALFRLGRNLEARRIADDLVRARDSVRDIALDMNLAVQSGDWDRFAPIIERVWEKRAEFDSRTLLVMSNMAGINESQRALDLAEEAVKKSPENPATLLSAYTIAVQMGRDDVGAPWLRSATQNSQPGGPIQSFTFRQMVEMLKVDHESWKGKNDGLHGGKMPLHLAALVFNAPLLRFLIDIPTANAAQVDARRRQPIPFRNGKRTLVDCSDIKRIAMDITTVYLLNHLKRLQQVLEQFDLVLVSPQLFMILLEERRKVMFHQPSRIREAKALVHLVSQRRLIEVNDKASEELTSLVGIESAALLTAAGGRTAGKFVHLGPVYDIGSYMETVADLAHLQPHVASVTAVARSLLARGHLSQHQFRKAKEFLESLEPGDEGGEFAIGAVFLDSSATATLERAGLLTPLLNAAASVHIHESAAQEWRSLSELEVGTAPATEAIENLRQVMRAHLLAGRLQLLAPSTEEDSDSKIGLKGMSLVELFSSAGEVEAVAIDDRTLNGAPTMTDKAGRATQLVCSIDLLNLLVQRGVITRADFDEDLHELRRSCLYTVPLDAPALRSMLDKASLDREGNLQETAYLRTLREYLARLIAVDTLSTQDDLVFLDSLWNAGAVTIRGLWSSPDTPIPEARAKSDWVAEHVFPAIEVAIRHVVDRANRAPELAAARASFALFPASGSTERQEAQREWVNDTVLGSLLPANSAVLDRIARVIEPSLIGNVESLANEPEDDALS